MTNKDIFISLLVITYFNFNVLVIHKNKPGGLNIMNELLLAQFLKPRVSVVHQYASNGEVWSYYGLNITEEFSMSDIIPSYCEAYLVLVDDKYRFYDKYKYSFDLISKEYAHNLVVSQKYENFVNFEVWLNDRFNQNIYFNYNKFSEKTKSMISKLINGFKKYEANTHDYTMTPKTCSSKYLTVNYMQYKYVNDREIKEWVGSATILDNGDHSPKRTVKAGHIVDKNKVVHQLYMNDYILGLGNGTFVIISEDVFKMLFMPTENGETQLISNQ